MVDQSDNNKSSGQYQSSQSHRPLEKTESTGITKDSVYGQLKNTVKQYGSQPFLHIPRQATKTYQDTAINYSYHEMDVAVEEAKSRYVKAGYGPGHRVALALDNRIDFFIHFFALNGIGVCVVPVNADFVQDEMTGLIEDSDVFIVISLPAHRQKLNKAKAGVDRAVEVLSIDKLDDLPAPPPADASTIRTGQKADAAILYTSGTTGKPKGCVLSNAFFLNVGHWYLNIGGYCKIEPGADRLITPLPVFHTNALVWSLMAMLMSGGCIIQLDRFHPSTWWESVRDSAANILHYLGVMPAMLLNMPATDKDRNRQIRFAMGAGVEPDIHARFEKRFGFPLIEGWAMTETGAGVCFMTDRKPRHVGSRCMGKVLDEMEFRIVNENNGDVAQGDAGELLVRRKGDNSSYGFFTEYYKNPQATTEAWKGGWFHTGDIVKEGEDGSVFFVERKKNIIRRSGENIAAAEVELVLIEHPGIVNCAVAPLPDPVREEEVAACVVLNREQSADVETAESLVNYCLQHLSYYKVPGYIIFVESLPLTSTQKIERGKLRALCLELGDSVKCIDCRHLKKKNRD